MNGVLCGRNRISLNDLGSASTAKRSLDEWGAGVLCVGSSL